MACSWIWRLIRGGRWYDWGEGVGGKGGDGVRREDSVGREVDWSGWMCLMFACIAHATLHSCLSQRTKTSTKRMHDQRP